MPQTVDRIDFAFDDVEPGQWPKLSCGGGNLLQLEAGSLQLEAERTLTFADNGQVRSFDDTHRLVFNRTGNLLELHEAGDIRFLTGAPTPTEKLRIRADGNVGIGTNTPGAMLHVTGAIRTDGTLAVTGDSNVGGNLQVAGSTNLNSNAQVQGNLQVNGILNAATIQQGGAPLRVSQWDNVTDGISYMNGRVGIGTTTPGAPLHVASYMAVGPFAATTGQGGIDVTGPVAELGFVRRTLTAWPANPAAGDRFVWYNPDGTARLWTEAVGDLLTVTSNGNLSFGARVRQMINLWQTVYGIGVQSWTQYYRTDGNFAWYRRGVHDDNEVSAGGGVVQMVIRRNDNVGISTADPAVKLHVIGNRIRLTKASDVSHFVDLRADGSALDLESRGADLFINNHGQTNTRIRNLVQISSQTLKENITSLAHQEALQVLQGLRSVKFSYKDDETSALRLGFIAEELPPIVATTDQTGFRPTDVLAALTTVVQEQARQITTLLKKVATLEAAHP